MTKDDLNLSKIVSLYLKDQTVKAIFMWLGDRERDPRGGETKAGNLVNDLANRGDRFTVDEVRTALEKIANAGCGSYLPGRPIENSRITWRWSAREIASMVFDEVSAAPGNDKADAEMETHYFPVRPSVTLEVKIRKDMSVVELQNMADFLQIIAKSRVTKH